MPSIQSMRDLLTRNKIFFETIATLSIGAMAILVSLAALDVSKTQTSIAAVQISPHVRVTSHLVYNDATAMFADEVFQIFNDGFVLHEFNASIKALLTIKVSKGAIEKSVTIPTVYTVIGIPTNNSTGLLWTFKQDGNNTAIAKLERDFHAAARVNISEFHTIKLTNLITVSYIDAIGHRQERFFVADGISEGTEISRGDAEKFLNAYQQKIQVLANIESIKSADLLSLLEIK